MGGWLEPLGPIWVYAYGQLNSTDDDSQFITLSVLTAMDKLNWSHVTTTVQFLDIYNDQKAI